MLYLYDSIEISIHALREEGDHREPGIAVEVLEFLSTPSARRATCIIGFTSAYCIYFYPRPPRGGRLLILLIAAEESAISIHALREEGD